MSVKIKIISFFRRENNNNKKENQERLDSTSYGAGGK
jgi:hypothetical protein